MAKHTQIICRLLLANCLSLFDHFVGLALKGLIDISLKQAVFTGKTISEILLCSKLGGLKHVSFHNSFKTNVHFLHPLKTSETSCFYYHKGGVGRRSKGDISLKWIKISSPNIFQQFSPNFPNN